MTRVGFTQAAKPEREPDQQRTGRLVSSQHDAPARSWSIRRRLLAGFAVVGLVVVGSGVGGLLLSRSSSGAPA